MHTLANTSSLFKSNAGSYAFIASFSAALNAVLLVAPVIADKIVEKFALSPAEVGGLFSVELAAFSLASFPAYLWIQRINLRQATIFFSIITIAGNIISGFAADFTFLIVIRFITALAAGSIIVILLTVAARASNPGRAFGVFVVSQLLMGAAILAVFPLLFANSDVALIYWSLGAIAAVALGTVPLLAGGKIQQNNPNAATKDSIFRSSMGSMFLIFGIASIFLFYVALSGVWTFMANISQDAGIDLPTSSAILSIATVAGVASSLVATLVGETTLRAAILFTSYIGMAVGVDLLFGLSGALQFTIAAVLFKFTWTIILPYLLSVLSEFGSAHIMGTVNIAMGAGFAVGPVLAGVLIEGADSFIPMLTVSLLGVVASMAFWVACGFLSRRSNRKSLSATISMDKPPIESA